MTHPSPAGTLVAFFALELALCAIPGPAVLFTTVTTLRRGPARGGEAVAGIVSGNSVYFVLSGIGVVALLLASYRAFAIVKAAGALYLAYLGVRSLFARVAEPNETAATERTGQVYAGALATQLANPKAIVFFAAIVPQFVDPARGVALQVAALALVSAVAEAGVLATYVLLAVRLRQAATAPRMRLWFERAGGAALLAVAAAVVREPFAPAAPAP